MPIYTYQCEPCKNRFEQFFFTISSAEPFIDKHKCDKCGKKAERIHDGAPKVIFTNSNGLPMYSDPSDPNR